MKSALSPRAVQDGGGVPYLNELLTTKEELDDLFGKLVKDGRALVEIFSHPPVDPGEPVIRIRTQLKNLLDEKIEIDKLWEEAWKSFGVDAEHGKLESGSGVHVNVTPGGSHSSLEKGPLSSNSASSASGDSSAGMKTVQSPSPKSVAVNGKVKKVSPGSPGLSRRNSDKFSELEEEAYEVRGGRMR